MQVPPLFPTKVEELSELVREPVKLVIAFPYELKPKLSAALPTWADTALVGVILVISALQELEMVTFTLFISKKAYVPTGSIFILPCEVRLLGIVIGSVPSLGVLANKMIGNVVPPSVENVIFTFPTFNGARFVLFTLQVSVAVLVPLYIQRVGEFCDVSKNGPELSTVTIVSSESTPPPLARLSRTVNLNFILRATCGKFSPSPAAGLLALFKICVN